jgi:CubicO group peptidase (beta-lactamase class C family)
VILRLATVLAALIVLFVSPSYGGVAPSSASATAATDPDRQARLDAVIDRAIDSGQIVGSVVLVVQDGELVYHRASGFADREAQTPMREDEIVRFSSVSKPIVSVAALSLVEQGKLTLGDPVTCYIPEFRPKLADGREPVITVRQLMTHTAGLNYSFFEPEDGPYHRAQVSDGMDQPGLSIDENLRRLASVPLLYEPGTAWGYSLATDVLGEVIARTAGQPLPQVVEQRVTGPLGMRDTGFAVVDPARLAIPYGDGPDRPVRMTEPYLLPFGASAISFSPARAFDPTSYPSGGAGMVGTAGDLARLLEALRAGGAPVLSPAGATALTTNAIGDLPVNATPEGWGFGLGVSVLKDPRPSGTPQSAGTWQWGGVYGHSWFVDPARRLTVVSMTNTGVAGMIGSYPDAIRDAVYGPGDRRQ